MSSSAGAELPVALTRWLRLVVLDLRRRPHRLFPPILAAGGPRLDRAQVDLAELGPHDAALRTDIAGALIEQVPECAVVWLTRPGALAWSDLEADWVSATLDAAREAGRRVRFVVVTRSGWWDPVGGGQQTWRRLRQR